MERVEIFAASDEKMAPGLGIALESVLAKLSGPAQVSVVLDGVREVNLKKFRLLGDKYDTPIRILSPLNREELVQATTTGDITFPTYFRLNIAEYLPDAKKVIYLDGDILCLGNLRELRNEPLDTYPIGAVADPAAEEMTEIGTELNQIGLPPNSAYFNAGVLLIDLEQWKREDVGRQILAHMNSVPIFGRWVDQSRLNFHFANRWKPLPLKYNVQIRGLGVQANSIPWLPESELEKVVRDAKIVHFNGPCKPWQTRTVNPFRQSYVRAWRRSPWRHWLPQEDLFREYRWYFGDYRRNAKRIRDCRKWAACHS